MQNAPAMLAQRMMNRQAPYGPVGMVSQNMSGNKKGVSGAVPTGAIGLAFDTVSASAGVVFSDANTTVTNPTANIRSAKATAASIPYVFATWYWEFTVRSSTQQMYIGVGLSSFSCTGTNRVGAVANSVGYNTGTGQVIANGATQTTIATATTGDVIGFKLEVFNPGTLLTILKNNVVILNQLDTSVWLPDYQSAWMPIWSGITVANSSATISNNIYSYAGCTPIGSFVTTVGASASVPAVADGVYDIYTFNASGTFTAGSTGAVRALVIAGGGGANGTGGGGAGGYQEKGIVVTPQTYVVTVGGGGGNSIQGNASSIGAAVTSVGGGAGTGSLATANGGSGGGASPSFTASGPYSATGGTGTAGQGNAGGSSSGTNDVTGGRAGGGGGGAGAVGGTGSGSGVGTGTGGSGGAGLSSNITGTTVTRAGGGGGAGEATAGSGGSGGGGAASVAPSTGTAGTANTGGGGGGASAAGGSGVVIIRVRARA